MNYYDEIKKVSEYESDLTFLVYEKFVLECIPKIIESAIKNNDFQILFEINYSDIHLTLGEGMNKGIISKISKFWPEPIIDIDFGPYTINFSFFTSLLSKIPGIELTNGVEDEYMEDGEIGKLKYIVNTKDLVDYYYEELQRIEHYKTNKIK